jgi:hypothetical protein
VARLKARVARADHGASRSIVVTQIPRNSRELPTTAPLRGVPPRTKNYVRRAAGDLNAASRAVAFENFNGWNFSPRRRVLRLNKCWWWSSMRSPQVSRALLRLAVVANAAYAVAAVLLMTG